MDEIMENNTVTARGQIMSKFTFSHKVFGESFYMVDVAMKRLSNQSDIIPVMVSERLIDIHRDYTGNAIEVFGQFRSYNRQEGIQNRLELSIFVREVHFIEEFTDCTKTNRVFLDGYICKLPTYRKTPQGREISDIILAVNRPYWKSDYIPCISWGRNARYASCLPLGARIQVEGRIQSRKYIKMISDAQCEERTAYEVSVSKIFGVDQGNHTQRTKEHERV